MPKPQTLFLNIRTLFSMNFLFCFVLFLFCSCQDRIITVVNIAIDLISYFLNLFASFGWQSAHTIYCLQFIRLNQRALLDHIKSIGFDAAKNGKSLFLSHLNINTKLYIGLKMLYKLLFVLSNSSTEIIYIHSNVAANEFGRPR